MNSISTWLSAKSPVWVWGQSLENFMLIVAPAEWRLSVWCRAMCRARDSALLLFPSTPLLSSSALVQDGATSNSLSTPNIHTFCSSGQKKLEIWQLSFGFPNLTWSWRKQSLSNTNCIHVLEGQISARSLPCGNSAILNATQFSIRSNVWCLILYRFLLTG